MPYVPPKDRTVFDPHVEALADCVVLAAKNTRDLMAVWNAIPPLVDAIKKEDKGYGYWGAFAGLLNYSCTEVLLKVLPTRPNIRYWEMPIVAGLADELSHVFRLRSTWTLDFDPLSEMSERWFSETPFGKEHAFGDVLEWTFANLALRVMPDNTRSSYREVAGVFRNIDAEFYSRLGVPYEDLKIGESGDVSYAEYVRAIEAAMEKKGVLGRGAAYLLRMIAPRGGSEHVCLRGNKGTVDRA